MLYVGNSAVCLTAAHLKLILLLVFVKSFAIFSLLFVFAKMIYVTHRRSATACLCLTKSISEVYRGYKAASCCTALKVGSIWAIVRDCELAEVLCNLLLVSLLLLLSLAIEVLAH